MKDKLKVLNAKLLKIHGNNPVCFKKYQLIAKILEDDDCFLKMPMEVSYAILRDLGISENNLKGVYTELMDK